MADVNARNALSQIQELNSRVDALEAKLEKQDQVISDRVEAEAGVRKAVDGAVANSVDALAEKHNALVEVVRSGR